MAIEDMDRKMAERVFGLRMERLKEQIRALSMAERLRLVADFLDADRRDFALAVLRLVLSELPTEELGARE